MTFADLFAKYAPVELSGDHVAGIMWNVWQHCRRARGLPFDAFGYA